MSFSGVPDSRIAYLAGIIDGEGSLVISCRRNENYIARMQVGMVEPRVIELLQETFGGKIYSSKMKSGRVIHRWHLVKSSEISACCEAILPYLIVKRTQAEALLAFSSHPGASVNKGVRTPTTEVERRRELYQIVKPLNAVGEAALLAA